jgi:NAD(P)H-flavin reductase
VREGVAATTALRASWAVVEKLGDHAAGYFFAALFALDPGLRDRFPVAMGEPRDRLLATLGQLISHVDDRPALTAFAARLGREHRRFDVRPEHYPLFRQALLHTLARLLGEDWTPELAARWSTLYEQLADVMTEAATQSARQGPARWDAEIVSHERRAADIAVIVARVAGDEPPGYRWRAGQSVAVESHRRPRVWRYLSPANHPDPEGTVEFHVRAVPGGQLSPALVYQAQVGDVLHLSAPAGDRLTVPPGPGPDLLLLAGGTGLAPMRAIVEQLAQANDRRKVTLIAGTAYRHELYDMETLWALGRRHRPLTVLAALAADPALGAPHTVAEAAVRNGSWHDRQIYVCGSPAMVAGTRALLTARGYPPEAFHIERPPAYGPWA